MRSQNFKSKAHFLLLFFLTCFSGILFGQRVVKGVVTDATSGDLWLEQILFWKKTIPTVLSLILTVLFTEVRPGTKMIIVSYTGYTTQEIDVSSSEVKVELMAGQILEDVVVIGYGTVKREDATGAIQAVTSEKFNRGAITGAQELIAGKVAGVSITTEGSPGAGSKSESEGNHLSRLPTILSLW